MLTGFYSGVYVPSLPAAKTQMNYFRLIAYVYFIKHVLIALINFKIRMGKTAVGMNILHVLPALLRSTAYSTVQTFIGNYNAAMNTQLLAEFKMFGSVRL